MSPMDIALTVLASVLVGSLTWLTWNAQQAHARLADTYLRLFEAVIAQKLVHMRQESHDDGRRSSEPSNAGPFSKGPWEPAPENDSL